MDNNNYENRRPRKRVTKKMAQRRRLAALGIIVLVIILGIILICKACSSDDDTKGNKTPKTSQSTTASTVTTANVSATAATTTTTSQPATADPDDPNTITKIELSMNQVYLTVGGDSQMPIVSMTPSSSTEKGEIWTTSDKTVATVDWLGNITPVGAGECIVTVASENNPSVYAEVKVTVTDPNGEVGGSSGQSSTTQGTTSGIQQTAENHTEGAANAAPSAHNGERDIQEVDGITYVNGILIANKSYSLPSSYAPGLDPTAESSFNTMAAAAANDGLSLRIYSGYRSYDYQSQIYNNYVSAYGSSTADTFSARPGHSEHQTGLAMDINCADDSFEGTPEAIWLAENCYKYGFIIRYPKGKESVTGYKYEPWHIRYLGVDTATAVYNSGLTLEEYLDIDSVYSN